jgi:hypothetical protein
MKNIYILVLIVCFTIPSFGQDSLMTEIVFKTSGPNPLKVYKLVKEKYIYYGSGHTDFDSDRLTHSHYPNTGISYEREYLLTAPGKIFIPTNKEVSYVIVDNKEKVSTRFTTTTDGRRQVWNLVPAGKNYKTGQKIFTMGVVGLLASGVILAVAVSQDHKYKADMNSYRMDLDFYNKTGINPSATANLQPASLAYAQGFLPSGSSLYSSGSAPKPPSDNRMGYGIPVISSTVSLTAMIAGIRMMFRNSPRAERIE